MRTTIRRWRRITAMAIHFVGVWLLAVVVAPRRRARHRQAMARDLAAQTLRLLGTRVVVRGPLPQGRPVLLVANHVSWLDVYALNCLMRTRFVAKREVEAWPWVGAMVAAFDTVFIQRGHFRDAHRVKREIADALRRGERFAVFPEGTTTDGSTLRPFHPALFQAAIDAGVSVQPVAIRYTDAAGTPIDAAAFIDDMSFGASLHRIAAEPAIRIELVFAPPISAAGRSRRALAALSSDWIAETLAVPSATRFPTRQRPALPRAA